MYNVIIVLDSTKDKSYYYSYVEHNGNIECEELPPYQDINKARSCYWDADAEKWVYDSDKYAEITANQKAEKEAAEQAALESEATPTNAELSMAVMELADNVSVLMDAVTELAGDIAMMRGGE